MDFIILCVQPPMLSERVICLLFFKQGFTFNFRYMFVYAYAWRHVCSCMCQHWWKCVAWGPTGAVVVSCSIWVLWTKLGFSMRPVCAPKQLGISQGPVCYFAFLLNCIAFICLFIHSFILRVSVCKYVGVPMPPHVWEYKRATFGIWVSLCTMWLPGIELMSQNKCH